MSYIKENPVTRTFGEIHSQLVRFFYFESDVLRKLGLPYKAVIPVGFIMDWESIWIFRGRDRIPGLIHDYLSRKDSIPVVSKTVAADVYLEFLNYEKPLGWWERTKYWCVRIIPGYFHKKTVRWVP